MKKSTRNSSGLPLSGCQAVQLIYTTLCSKLIFLVTLFCSTAFLTVSGQTAGKNYQHWADGDLKQGTAAEWNNNILSANKSDYFEGEVIPHVAVLPASNNAPLVQDQTYSFTIVYNYYQQNTNAGGFAFITTYNISRQPDPFLGVTPIKDPNGNTGTGIQGDFYVNSSVDIISASAPVTTSSSGTRDQTVTVTFKWLDATTTSGSAMIFYGLYIARPKQIQGVTNSLGAHAWSGGSLQTTLNSTFTGGLSLQLAPSAIIAGLISGLKYNDLNGNHTRDAGEPVLSGWTIYLDNNNNGKFDAGIDSSTVTDANGLYSFSVTPDADQSDPDNDPYYVREIQQNGWTQTEPTTVFYGPFTISAATPQYTGKNFGNTCANPTADAGTPPTAQCFIAGGNTFTLNGTGSSGTPSWAVQTNTNNLSVTITNGTTFTPTVTVTGVGSVTLRLTVTGTCGTPATSDVTVTVNPNPTISGPAIGSVCPGITSASVSYTGVTGSPDQYSIDWNSTAEAAGLTDISYTSPLTNPFSITIPGNLASGTYNGTIYVKNSTTGCVSSGSAISLTVNAHPDAPSVTYVPPTCTQTTFSVKVGSPTAGTYVLTQLNNNTFTKHAPADVVNDTITFSGLAVGQGYSVTYTNTSGCTSGSTECGTFTKSNITTSTQLKAAPLNEGQTKILAYPNPFSNSVKFNVQPGTSGPASFELYTLTGQRVKTLFQGTVQKGQTQTFMYNVAGQQQGTLIYVFRIGNVRTTGKVVNIK